MNQVALIAKLLAEKLSCFVPQDLDCWVRLNRLTLARDMQHAGVTSVSEYLKWGTGFEVLSSTEDLLPDCLVSHYLVEGFGTVYVILSGKDAQVLAFMWFSEIS